MIPKSGDRFLAFAKPALAGSDKTKFALAGEGKSDKIMRKSKTS